MCFFYYLFFSWGETVVSPLGAAATVWPIVLDPDDR
jgi:hypothetical protein